MIPFSQGAIPAEILDRPVAGMGLMPGCLGDQLSGERTLLVFLRHFGCIFCRETIADLRALAEERSDFPDVLFFFQGSPIEGRAYLRRAWPAARAIADPDLELYEAFGIRRAGIMEALGPEVWRSKRRAKEKGHANGPRDGDIWRMPGTYLAKGHTLVWAHAPKHAGDHPDFDTLP